MKVVNQVCSLKNYSKKSDFINDLGSSRSFAKKYMKNLSDPINEKEVLSIPIDVLNRGLINPLYNGEKIEIIHECEKFLALNKPTKVHMHPHSYSESDNILSFLRSQNLNHVLEVNSSNYDRGLLYRLDYETSGIVVLSKSNELYELIRNNFNEISKRKIYLTIVEGKLEGKEYLESKIIESGVKGKKMKLDENGKSCSLSYEVIRSNEKFSLLKVELETGLRHQIRCQLASIGHSIIGDNLYGNIASDRLYLHAYEYEFEVNNQIYNFKSKKLELFSKFFNVDSIL